jgi:mannose-6-phosphate isomerase-like protein (cupin superfamily)
MHAFELDELAVLGAAADEPYVEFVRTHDLSVGLYILPAGAIDRQSPHTEDEVYHVVRGAARMTVGDEVREVRAGSIVFVPAGVVHLFHDITEDLTILVAFGPAEGRRA